MGCLPGPRINIWRRPSSWPALYQSWSGALAKAGVGQQLLPAGASHHAKRGQGEWSLTRAPNRRLQKVDWVEEMPGPHTNWWWELVGILGINDFQKLAQKIRASFEIPWVNSKTQDVKNWLFRTTSPKCICQKGFLPLQDPRFPSQDFRHGKSQKSLAYAQGLQYWAKKANPPMLGQPCLLVRCVQELRWMMKPYVAFTDDTILEGEAPL